jgi:2-dehydro-3-deoxyphosphooctonate aldolase (KDO 8-P synthase)
MQDIKTIIVGYGNVNQVEIGGNKPLSFIGGPCAIESRDHAFKMAELISKVCS